MASIIEQALSLLEQISSYRCVVESHRWGKETRHSKQRYMFRKPGHIRMEMIGNYNKGAVIVASPDGKILARPGGMFSFMTVDLDKYAYMLKGFDRNQIVESDWKSILEQSAQLKKKVTGQKTRRLDYNGVKAIEVITKLEAKAFDTVRMVIRRDGPILLIERFQRNRLLARTLWYDIELNPELEWSLFAL